MPEKFNSRDENRERGGINADRQERAGKWKDIKHQGRPDQPGSPNRQPVQEQFQQPNQQETPGNAAGLPYYKKLLQGRRQQNRENGPLQGAQTREGCLPKLFMLVLPLMAVGAYLLHMS